MPAPRSKVPAPVPRWIRAAIVPVGLAVAGGLIDMRVRLGIVQEQTAEISHRLDKIEQSLEARRVADLESLP